MTGTVTTNPLYQDLSETDPMPLKEAYAELKIEPRGPGKSQVIWSMDYRTKYGPIGWLMGQTLMKMMMGKVLDGNLKGLEESVQANNSSATKAA